MAEKEKGKNRFTHKLLHKYRLVILNEDTFEERFAIKLTRLNVFVILSMLTILLITGTTMLIAYTPLREYIPGYSSTALKKQATELSYKTDSLQRVIIANDSYLESIKRVLTGDVSAIAINKDSILDAAEKDIDPKNLIPLVAAPTPRIV